MASHKGEAAPAAAAVVGKRTPEELAQMAALSVGAQVILDFNGAGSIGARGGAGSSIEENTIARDAHLAALGFDPNAPSGPPTAPDPAGAVHAVDTVVGHATRMSSLAAGIITGDGGNVPPGGGGGATAPANTAPPAVTQAADTLTCTTGEWSGEPTSYSYAWTVDAVAAGTDAATYTVVAADIGKSASCIVTATNAVGSVAAPPSAGLVIADPAGATRARSSK